MPTKKELEAENKMLKKIMEGRGLDPKKDLDDYVKIGEYLYPKDAPVTLIFERFHSSFKWDYDRWLNENRSAIKNILYTWRIDDDSISGIGKLIVFTF